MQLLIIKNDALATTHTGGSALNAQSSKPMQGGSMDNVHNLTPEQDIEQQAADWLLRLAAEHKPSKSEIDELTAWVQRSPAHKE